MLIGNEFYEKLIYLCHSNPITQIIIKIYKPSTESSEDFQKFNNFKKLFYDAKFKFF